VLSQAFLSIRVFSHVIAVLDCQNGSDILADMPNLILLIYRRQCRMADRFVCDMSVDLKLRVLAGRGRIRDIITRGAVSNERNRNRGL
jgi:hypothetical protein